MPNRAMFRLWACRGLCARVPRYPECRACPISTRSWRLLLDCGRNCGWRPGKAPMCRRRLSPSCGLRPPFAPQNGSRGAWQAPSSVGWASHSLRARICVHDSGGAVGAEVSIQGPPPRSDCCTPTMLTFVTAFTQDASRQLRVPTAVLHAQGTGVLVSLGGPGGVQVATADGRLLNGLEAAALLDAPGTIVALADGSVQPWLLVAGQGGQEYQALAPPQAGKEIKFMDGLAGPVRRPARCPPLPEEASAARQGPRRAPFPPCLWANLPSAPRSSHRRAARRTVARWRATSAPAAASAEPR